MSLFRVPFVGALLGAILSATDTAAAQTPEAMREIQEIATRIDEQLREIDRLLLESSKKGQPRQTPKQLLQQAKDRSEAVESGIDKLIEKLRYLIG